MMELADRNLRLGWWLLLGWLALGIVLEVLHGFKLAWYLAPEYDVRRLMFTLAHAHGTLLALINIAAGLTGRLVKGFALGPSAARSLVLANWLLPAGFFTGGVVIHDGDPGLGVWLVPVGAILLLHGVARVALDLRRVKSEPASTRR
jgi:hypothetical protein